MNTNWIKILLFSLLFGIAGFFVGRTCMSNCGDRGSCHAEMSGCSKGGKCEHGGGCCKAGGECSKKGCEHASKCGHGGHRGYPDGSVTQDEMHGDSEVHRLVEQLEASNFQGDTSITIDGGTANIHRTDDKVEVKVEVIRTQRRDAHTIAQH
ncbi:MAG: hypothetical protein R2818_14795 [Flavobacteriales bacterium]